MAVEGIGFRVGQQNEIASRQGKQRRRAHTEKTRAADDDQADPLVTRKLKGERRGEIQPAIQVTAGSEK